jgi:hypothetical protein
MLIPMLLVVSGIAGALVIAMTVQSSARFQRVSPLPALRFDSRSRPRRRLAIAEHRRALAYRRRRLRRRAAYRASTTH